MVELDLLIFGSGPAASRVAEKCSEAGWRIGIVDPRPFGGTCALRGCNPKKVLVRAAELYDWISRAEHTGVRVEEATIDWAELIRFKRTFTDSVTGGKEKSFREAGIAMFHGHPRFISPDRVVVDDQEITSRKFVIATGAVPATLDIPGEELMTTSDELLELEQLPRRVLFVGGGYVAFEFAHVAVRAGAEVTIAEAAERPLARFEPELVDCLVDRSRELGIDVQTSAKVQSIERGDSGELLVTLAVDDRERTVRADLVVHGAGRVPNTYGLDLEAGDIHFGPGGITVNEFQQSVSNPQVYAAGDVANTEAPPLSPVANHEARLLAENLLDGNQHRSDCGPVATVVFTVPALASVGMGEDQAKQRELDYTVKAGDRSNRNAMKKVGATHARYKVLVENGTDVILGAHLLGPDAAETINLFALAIKHGITASGIKSTLLAFPTFAHEVREMI
jgi:glutathione reductase (NADPH)